MGDTGSEDGEMAGESCERGVERVDGRKTREGNEFGGCGDSACAATGDVKSSAVDFEG